MVSEGRSPEMLAKCFFGLVACTCLCARGAPCVMVCEGRSPEMLAKCFFQASGLHLPVRKGRFPLRNGVRGAKPRDACTNVFFRLVVCACLCAGRSPEMLS